METYRNNLLELEAYTIDYGVYDYFSWIPDGCIFFSQLLTEEDIPHELLSFNGGHSNMVRQRIEEQIFPFFSNILECDSLVSINYSESGMEKLKLNNYPNPFNPETTIFFKIPSRVLGQNPTRDFNTRIEIYNLEGQKVKTFSNLQINKSPNQQIIWDGTDDNGNQQPTGIYFINLKVNGENIGSKKCLLLK